MLFRKEWCSENHEEKSFRITNMCCLTTWNVMAPFNLKMSVLQSKLIGMKRSKPKYVAKRLKQI